MIYDSLHASALKFCQDFATKYPGMAVVNFDAHADDSTVPSSDLIGMAGITMMEDEGILDIKMMFGVSTINDKNNFRLVSLVSALFESLRPRKTIDLYESVSGVLTKKGSAVCTNGTTILPVGGKVERPLQYVAVHLLTSVNFTPVQ